MYIYCAHFYICTSAQHNIRIHITQSLQNRHYRLSPRSQRNWFKMQTNILDSQKNALNWIARNLCIPFSIHENCPIAFCPATALLSFSPSLIVSLPHIFQAFDLIILNDVGEMDTRKRKDAQNETPIFTTKKMQLAANDSYEWNIFKVQRCRNPFDCAIAIISNTEKKSGKKYKIKRQLRNE